MEAPAGVVLQEEAGNMLPVFKDESQNFMLMQNRWKSELDPLLENPMSSVSILKNVLLAIGNNVINHRLGKKQQGWFLTDVNGVSSIYRSAAFNDLTLTLNSSAVVTVSIGVF